jgi:hypothetical protein
LGGYRIANISGVAWFGPGGYLTGLGFLLLVVAYLLRDSKVTIGEAAAALRRRVSRDSPEDDDRGGDAGTGV